MNKMTRKDFLFTGIEKNEGFQCQTSSKTRESGYPSVLESVKTLSEKDNAILFTTMQFQNNRC